MPQPVSRMRLELGGPFAAHREDRRVAFAYRGAERLLAYLALRGESPRDEIAAALWPKAERARALASLRQALRAVAAAGRGWIFAEGRTLRLSEEVRVDRSEGGERLLKGWDDPWIAPFRAAPEGPDTARSEDALRGLFDLLAYLGARSPEGAIRVAGEGAGLLLGAPPLRTALALKRLLDGTSRVTAESWAPWMILARAHYLQGGMEEAFNAYERVIVDLGAGPPERVTDARLSQIVVLREGGAAGEAARRAERAAAEAPPTPFYRWTTAYQLGYSRHLAGAPLAEGLWLARDAVENSAASDDPILRAFPFLNVAQALLDAGETHAAERSLALGTALARVSGDPLALLTAETTALFRSADEADAESIMGRLRELEAEAWRARFAPFAAGLADRAALLAHRFGLPDESSRALERSDRIRRRLGLRRTLLERRRLARLPGA